MKDLYQVLEQKKTEIERLRREIEALHFVIPLLAENADWVEKWPGFARLALSGDSDCDCEKGGPGGNTSREESLKVKYHPTKHEPRIIQNAQRGWSGLG